MSKQQDRVQQQQQQKAPEPPITAPASAPAPAAASLAPTKPAKEKAWLNVSFNGYDPDDSRSSLLRRWRGLLRGLRSDGETIAIPIVSLQADTPQKVGEDLSVAFDRLETYRNCDCRVAAEDREAVLCSKHDPKNADNSGNAENVEATGHAAT